MFLLGKNYFWQRAVSKNKIVKTLRDYDRLVACGIAPAILLRCDRNLDIFYPYATGVEFLGTGEFLVRFKCGFSLKSLIFMYVLKRQAIGIKAAKFVLNSELSLTEDVLKSIGVESKNLMMPMLYDGELMPEDPPTQVLQDVWSAIKPFDFTLLHTGRLMWVNPGNYSSDAWRNENKNNDLLIYAFADFTKIKPERKSILMIIEYGPDVARTKHLVDQLGIKEYVFWLPQMDRREIFWLISRVSICVGEFYDIPKMIWGGTGWEALAGGKPLLQGFNFCEGEFERQYGYPPPPILAVKTREDIVGHLISMSDHPLKRDEIGLKAKEWFSRYNGINLARKWLDLTMAPRRSEVNKSEEMY
jgi:hypothetical protein